MDNPVRGIAAVAILALAAGAVLVAVNQLTSTRIANNRTQERLRTIRTLVADHPAQTLVWRNNRAQLCGGSEQLQYTTAAGYAGDISLIVATDTSTRTVSGVRVLQHTETPGLGDVIEVSRSNWILTFSGIAHDNVTGIDTVTGATITSRAVIAAVALLDPGLVTCANPAASPPDKSATIVSSAAGNHG